MSKERILVVEDDQALAELVCFHLERASFTVDRTADGNDALERVRESPPDLIILDWMIEGLPGIDVCRHIRARKSTREIPIIMMTARGEESDRIRGLDTGADDYITKPFSPRELLARIGAVLRRGKASAGAAGDVLRFADLEMDLSRMRVLRGGIAVQLAPMEFRLLRHLMESPRRVFSRDALLAALWDRDADVDGRAVDGQIRRIRRVLNAGGKPNLIRTVRYAGYALDTAADVKTPG